MALTNGPYKTVSDLSREVNFFDKNWTRSFVNGRANYVATRNNATIIIYAIRNGKLSPRVRLTFNKGSKVVIIGTAVHYPPVSSRKVLS
jgi:hypothetical protein